MATTVRHSISDLRTVLFLALSVTFLFVYEISPEPLNGFAPIDREDVSGPSSHEFKCQGQRSKVKVTTDKKNDNFGRYLGNRCTDLRQIHTEDVFALSLRRI